MPDDLVFHEMIEIAVHSGFGWNSDEERYVLSVLEEELEPTFQPVPWGRPPEPVEVRHNEFLHDLHAGQAHRDGSLFRVPTLHDGQLIYVTQNLFQGLAELGLIESGGKEFRCQTALTVLVGRPDPVEVLSDRPDLGEPSERSAP